MLRHRRRDGAVVQGLAQLLVGALEHRDMLLDRALVETLDVDDHRVDPVDAGADGLLLADLGGFARGAEATSRTVPLMAGAR